MAWLESLKRPLIIGGYTLIFWVALPLALVIAGQRLDVTFGLASEPSPWGWPLLVGGLAFLAWAALWLRIHGHGLPVSALPPTKLVARGPYGILRHPMYAGYNVALVGLALILGSRGLLILGGPIFLGGWVAYALFEERSLRRRFGAEFQAYQTDVALWPRPPLYQIVQTLVAARALPVKVEGREWLPRGPYVIVANHACYLDPVLLSRVTWRPIRFLATAEAFRPRLFGWALRRAGAIPLRRYRVDPVACRKMTRHLSYGEIAGLFVEGERSPLGAYEGAMPRAAGIIARLGVPIIPVGVRGSYDVGPRWSDVLRRRPVTLRIGAPVVVTGQDPARAIDAAIQALLAGWTPQVHLSGLPRERLSRILWACPRCLEEGGWDAATLRCSSCGARYTPTGDGLFADTEGRHQSLADLGERLVSVVTSGAEIRCPADGFTERSQTGPIRPMESIGAGELLLTPSTLKFTPREAGSLSRLTVPMESIRSVTTERADTLQVATRMGVWQFRPQAMSVFRLHRAVMTWAAPALERPLRST